MVGLTGPCSFDTQAPMEGQPPAGAGSGAVINRLLQIAFEAMSDIWLARMRLQAGLALIVGLFLVAFGFIGTWMFTGRPKGAPLFDVGQNP